jgi:hypothetical protein
MHIRDLLIMGAYLSAFTLDNACFGVIASDISTSASSGKRRSGFDELHFRLSSSGAGHPAPPSQIRACVFLALGSSREYPEAMFLGLSDTG